MDSSTGDLLVDDEETLREILARISRRAAFHAEDEARLRARASLRREGDPASHSEWRDAEAALAATERLLRLATEAGKRVHVLHVSTAAEIELLALHKDVASVEVTPQHLTLIAEEAYAKLGTKAQMNPPLRSREHRDRLWWGIDQGVVDVLGSDHAPHSLEEKAQSYPASPSGMPGVQTLVPVMLDHVAQGRLSLARFVDLTSAGPARIFGIAGKGRIAVGYDADLTLVDLKARRVIEDAWIASRCGWTPFAGKTVQGWPWARSCADTLPCGRASSARRKASRSASARRCRLSAIEGNSATPRRPRCRPGNSCICPSAAWPRLAMRAPRGRARPFAPATAW